jgi:polysaccharide pyruvyl transferase WcaK-like protein
VTVVSRDPASTSALHGVPAIALGGVVGALRRHRSIIIGGGGLFGRDMGAIGRLLPAFGLAARALRRSVLIEGVDVDSVLSPTGRVLLPALMRRAAHVSVRDRRSAELLRGWGVDAELAPDLSAWMPAAPAQDGSALLRSAGVDPRRPVVGLALNGLVPARADEAVAAAASVMDAMPETQFVFLPMSRHPRVPAHDDLVIARRLRDLRPELLVVEAEASPAVMLAAFSQLGAVVAMRYHAMLFAERCGVPLVPLPYAEKTERWLQERGREPVPARALELVAALRDAIGRVERIASPLPPPARAIHGVASELVIL